MPRATLSHCTLLWGANGSGKSVLLEVAACVSQSKHAGRFAGNDPENQGGMESEFRAEILYSTAESVEKRIDLQISNGHVTRSEGLSPCLLPPGDIEFIYCSAEDISRKYQEDDVDFLMNALSIDRSALVALLKHGTTTVLPGTLILAVDSEEDENGNSRPRQKENGEPYWQLRVKLDSKSSSLGYTQLSGSEQTRIILDLLISKAREVAKQRLTILLIDHLVSSFDAINFGKVLNTLSLEEFQSVVAMPAGQTDGLLDIEGDSATFKELPAVRGWRLVTLQGKNSLLNK